MTASTKNNFQNFSGPAGLNRGGNGKFTPSQTEERVIQHAKSIATGIPTLPQIIDIWKERFGISITIQSEKEWRRSNLVLIEKKKAELIESGEIAVPVVGEEALSDSVLTNALTVAKLLRETRLKASLALKKIDLDKEAGTPEFKAKLEAYKVLVHATSELNDSFLDHTTLLFQMSGKIKIKDNKIKEMVDNRLNERIAEIDEDDESVLGLEVTDAMRQKLAEAQEGV